VDVEKTTNGIISRRELHLSKEALLERKACHLTKRFMKMAQEREQEKLKSQAEHSKKLYEQTVQRAQHASQAQKVLEQMVHEQRGQILELMRDKGRQRQDEERLAREERAERERWVQARMIYDQMESERRSKQKEEREREVQEKIKEKGQRYEEAAKLIEEEKKAQQKMKVEREEKKAEEAEKRRRARALEARAQSGVRTERLEQADTRRQQLAEEAQKSAREAIQKREQKVRELKQKADRELEERKRRYVGKLTDVRSRSEGSQQGRQLERPPAQEDVVRQSSGVVEEPGSPKHQEVKASPQPSIYYYCTPRVGQDLVNANVRVQKEYVRRRNELAREEHEMFSRKQFKNLAEAAKTMGDKYEGGYTRKLRSLHRMYIDPKPREDRSTSASPRDGAAASGSKSTPRPPLDRRTASCALCDREVPLESLEGRALRTVVERFRQQMPCLPREGRWARERGALLVGNDHVKKVGSIGEATCSTSKSERPPESLYDYEVRICTSCWHYIRVANT